MLGQGRHRHPGAAVLVLQVHTDPEPLEPAGADPAVPLCGGGGAGAEVHQLGEVGGPLEEE